MRIPHFYFFIGSFGQSGFYSHNVGSSLPGFFFFPTGQLEHLHDVFLILGTDLFTVLIFLQVIIPITQPQTSLIGLLPVLTSTGKGADIMVPMAIPTFGGMLIQSMTMFVVPVFQCWWREGLLKKEEKARNAAENSSPGK